MTYTQWNSKTPSASPEDIWEAAKKDAWANVFQVVSDRPDLATREFIKRLEAARNTDNAITDNAGPK